MKIFLKSIFLPFLLSAVAALLVQTDTMIVPDLFKEVLSNYSDKRAAAKSYPILVFTLLFIAAASEALAVIGITLALLDKGFDKALSMLLSVGCALLGVITGLSFALWLRGDLAQASQGIWLFFIVLIFVLAPVGLAFSVRLLGQPYHNPAHQKIMKWVTLGVCCSLCLLSLYGIIQHIFG